MSQVTRLRPRFTALDELDELVDVLHEYDCGEVSGQLIGEQAEADAVLDLVKAAAHAHGVEHGAAQYGGGDEDTAAAMLVQFRDDLADAVDHGCITYLTRRGEDGPLVREQLKARRAATTGVAYR